MTQVWARIRRWFQTPAPRSPLWPEYSYAAFMLAFGVALLLPSDAFTLSANYAVLSRIGNEAMWGIGFTAFGGLWFLIVATHNLHLRRLAAIPGAVILTWLALSVFLSNVNSTIGLPYLTVALAASYGAGRLVAPWTQRQ